MSKSDIPERSAQMPLVFESSASDAIELHVLPQDGLEAWLKDQPAATASWVLANGFTGAIGQALMLPDQTSALAGYGTSTSRARGRFALAAAAAKLPAGAYRIASGLTPDQTEIEALGWLLSSYRFDRYKSATPMAARLIAPEGIDTTKVEAIAAGEALTRNLINTPAL